jgi:molybdopterin synthase catalytic subunit
MNITVRFFAVVRDRAGISQMELKLDSGTTVARAAEAIGQQLPQLKAMMPRVAFAVNQTYVDRDTVLSGGDELALIPPVSGG